jgi:hypothetical protein
MITPDTRIDYDRVSDVGLISVAEALNQAFGVGFFDANRDQKLVLIEALSFTLRDGGTFRENLLVVASGGCPVGLPPNFPATAPLETNEGLRLLAILHEAIVEDYSVALERISRGYETIDDYAGEAVLDRFVDPEELNVDR